mmetsp:Transcript_18158/g.51218  ORF Transcript_18158/g.51218 Transcript_18158/m.51218 type:complete len:220 (-) Transcript_18158:107-766(-)|eukprot:CAMPEP_0119121188 /NCGR_PEP_ID=MMETSP1310-20130426/1936_1 /TAXON_ID=464262 /ORGANISM="Genus nov. species nov., Strain RCC2339" /LENGTH=219 /DNA_ID=CAMNT_0007110737 /DNA_START=194 /DNA_END=853 /DNA_ORIENTATION=-
MKILLLLLGLAVASQGYIVSDVETYYESMCPDSKAFITTSLQDAYDSVPELFHPRMVPFGKATAERAENGTIVMSCQHGPQECDGNMQQACLIATNPDYNVHLPMIICIMGRFRTYIWEYWEACGEIHNVPIAPIKECVESGRGAELFLNLGQLQAKAAPKLDYVPWLNVNLTHTPAQQEAAEDDLTRYLCSLQVSGTCPSGCLSLDPPLSNCETRITP